MKTVFMDLETPGLLAHLVTSKYVDALPLYRQEAIFARYGVSLPRSTQAAWIIAQFLQVNRSSAHPDLFAYLFPQRVKLSRL